MSDIKEKLKRCPETFGVYLMKDRSNNVIYVGKAKNLKSRLSSYFLRHLEDPKTKALVDKITDFEVILLTNEVEALLLERNLIKQHKPHFNIILRDDKEYPYLRIDMQNLWPRIKKVRRRKNDGAVYLGPYSHVSSLNSILDLTYRIFPLIRCSEHTFNTVKRPCNYYEMKRCLGPCTLPVDNKAYKEMMQNALDFLQGKDRTVQKKLKEKMTEASEEERYEDAGRLYTQLQALKIITQAQNVVIKEKRDCDAIGFSQDQDHISFHILNVRDGKITGRDNFITSMRLSDKSKALSDFLIQYYEKSFIPNEIYLPLTLDDEGGMEDFLYQKDGVKVKILVPQRGQKKNLVDLSTTNSRYHLEESLTKRAHEQIALENLKEKLSLKKFPFRIHCFDISNIQGTAIVASQVCFIGAKPSKQHYRLYNIDDTRESPDDYWSLRTVMERYFSNLTEAPDLLVIDGGRGQLSSVLSVAERFPEYDFDIISIAKNRTHYEKSDLSPTSTQERIFFPRRQEPFVLVEGSSEYLLLTRLRDEAHRFAITQHRRRRKKLSEQSVLDTVEGLGPVMKKRLLKELGDIEVLKTMGVEDFIKKGKIPKNIAEKLFRTLRDLV